MASYPNNIFATGSYRPTTNEPLIINKHWDSIANEIPAIESELGTNPAGSYTDVKSRMDAGGVGTAITVNSSAPSNSLTLDSNGYLSTAQVGFRARGDGTSTTGDIPIVPLAVQYDTTNSYNSTTSPYNYTAPVSGYYCIYASSNFNGGVATGYFSAWINSVRVSLAYKSSSDAWHMVCMHDIRYMAANDVLRFQYNGDPDVGVEWFFYGAYRLG